MRLAGSDCWRSFVAQGPSGPLAGAAWLPAPQGSRRFLGGRVGGLGGFLAGPEGMDLGHQPPADLSYPLFLRRAPRCPACRARRRAGRQSTGPPLFGPRGHPELQPHAASRARHVLTSTIACLPWRAESGPDEHRDSERGDPAGRISRAAWPRSPWGPGVNPAATSQRVPCSATVVLED